MPPAPPDVFVGASPTKHVDFLRMLNVTIQEDVDGLSFLADLAIKFLPTHYSLESDDDGRTFYWNRVTKEASWYHPHHGVLETAVDCYRRCHGDPDKVIQAFNVAKRSLQTQKVVKRNISRTFSRQETFQQKSEETSDGFKLLETAFIELWASAVLKMLKDKQMARSVNDQEVPVVAEDHVLGKVLSFPLPAPWATKQADGQLRYINTEDLTENEFHPMHALHKELEDAAGESAALTRILEKQSLVEGDERLLCLLCVREIWGATCTSSFPRVFPWLEQSPGKLQISKFLEICTERPSLSVATQEATEFVGSPRDADLKVKQGSSLVLLTEESERKIESAIRLESIEFLTIHFGCNMTAAVRALSGGTQVITRETFKRFFEKHTVAAPPYPADLMFDAIDAKKRGSVTKEDLYLADDDTIAMSQSILQSVTDSMLQLIAKQVMRAKPQAGFKDRPKTAELPKRIT